jgi:hypothetical protein
VARPARALLISIVETNLARADRSLHRLETNGAALLRGWAEVDLPLLFAATPAPPREPAEDAATDEGWSSGASSESRHPQWRLGLRNLVLSPNTRSLLRHGGFLRLFEDLGGPLLILVGDALGDVVLETAIDGFTSGHPIIVVTDAAPPGLEAPDASLAARADALALLSCFARLMTAGELMKEWIGAD